MADQNKGLFNGRVAKKEVRKHGENKIVNMSIAVNYYDRKEKTEKAVFINASIFGHQAEYMDNRADIGDLVHLEGEWRPNIYNSRSGEKHSELRLSVTNCNVLCKKGAGAGSTSAAANTASGSSADKGMGNPMNGFYPMDEELEEDDLPF